MGATAGTVMASHETVRATARTVIASPETVRATVRTVMGATENVMKSPEIAILHNTKGCFPNQERENSLFILYVFNPLR